MYDQQQISALTQEWANEERWKGVLRPYTAEDVARLRGSIQIEHTLVDTRELARLASRLLGDSEPAPVRIP